MDINLVGVFLGIQHGAEAMKRNSTGGSIINVTSCVARKHSYGSGAYGTSKAAVEHLSRVAATEYAPHKIRVNCVAPGQTTTEMFDQSYEVASKAYGLQVSKEQFFKDRLAGVPLGIFSTPEEMASPLIFFASDESKYATGASILMDGGLTLH
jgi:3alpha(or 20beta)-hydroxysteroid dehydrogenase